MRRFSLLITASFLTCALALAPAAAQQAPADFVGSTAPVAGVVAGRFLPAAGPADAEDDVVLSGKITNPAGPLPGAVIILKATKQMAVTNAEGEFQFVVPATAGALDAVVTYAGYADEAMTLNAAASESTVNLTDARVIVVSRKQQLKTFLKTARKQVKHDLREVRRSQED
ncbi:carboxypeptidase-like regulatory domain-containing protein [Hymenobacter sp.]|uniref:carboxypeptidase-like regulatory domain-containing protein n=1 Tax=Hymenobacter sp. TaxID=1898978 RepID=UPI00286B6E47|nr:carboxypeptidase-like regulatory domain-containing protein [Hymenobacter sp.]